ncbi:MAG: hypothetical protein NZV14_09850 [Bryobacteraceae bacterium]|nr:hypothetical protein [Bryobacteraceae bacterium]MDW8378454.1 hypothetical protein [Bryobacterales bacterium]
MKIPIQDDVNGRTANPQRRIAALVGLASVWIVGAVVLPSALLVFWRCARLLAWWDWWVLASPCFYLYVYACLSATFQPLFAVPRVTPLLQAHDVRWRVAAPYVLWNCLWALLSALFWHGVAWGAFPLVSSREIRFVPFYPWPGWRTETCWLLPEQLASMRRWLS